jgi:hypothetical protein
MIRKQICAGFLMFIFSVLFAQAQEFDAQQKAVMHFDTTHHDFKIITFAEPAFFTFSYTNTGKIPLTILSIKNTCGCMIVTSQKMEVLPGESSFITIHYNTRKIGTFKKGISVFSNADNSPVVLMISGTVRKQNNN